MNFKARSNREVKPLELWLAVREGSWGSIQASQAWNCGSEAIVSTSCICRCFLILSSTSICLALWTSLFTVTTCCKDRDERANWNLSGPNFSYHLCGGIFHLSPHAWINKNTFQNHCQYCAKMSISILEKSLEGFAKNM